MNYIELEGELINLDQAKSIYRRRIHEDDSGCGYRIIIDHGDDDGRVIEYEEDKEQWLHDWDRIVKQITTASEVPNDG